MRRCSTNQGQQLRKSGRGLGDGNELIAPGHSTLGFLLVPQSSISTGLTIFFVEDRFSLGTSISYPCVFHRPRSQEFSPLFPFRKPWGKSPMVLAENQAPSGATYQSWGGDWDRPSRVVNPSRDGEPGRRISLENIRSLAWRC